MCRPGCKDRDIGPAADLADAAAAELHATGCEAIAIALDVTDPSSNAGGAAAIAERLGTAGHRRRQRRMGRARTLHASAPRSNRVHAGAKATVIGFTKSLAREIATSGVTAKMMCRGPTDTPPLSEMA